MAGLSRLLLDTGVLIQAERRRSQLDEVITDEDDVCLAAISAAELLEGVERADPRRRPAREAFVEAVLQEIPIVDYTVGVARVHARLLAHTRAFGTPRGAHDLIVASTALATERSLVTTDGRAAFESIPGLEVRLVKSRRRSR
jgi:tRNA(fMet)-specific endonuclease VapC